MCGAPEARVFGMENHQGQYDDGEWTVDIQPFCMVLLLW